MRFGPGLVEGRFLTRLNRFAALVDVAGEEVMVHVANSGRMRELLVPGYRVLLKPAPGEHRKTQFDLALVDLKFVLASADARLPNALVAEALEAHRLPQFQDYPVVRREVTFGESRLDLMLEGHAGKCYIETKSVTLVEDRVGLFPDAPTTRGVKHMNSLAHAVEAGHRAAVVFVVQRDDADYFAPHDEADPVFGQALRKAMAAGVEAFAYNCRVDEQSITLANRLPFKL
ncbi:MAG: DNA/RNA nuclease SfsA [Chloroflexi bacterium]|nr:DNA/RNA nuclease SfsA [Chloroflexota bacterium]